MFRVDQFGTLEIIFTSPEQEDVDDSRTRQWLYPLPASNGSGQRRDLAWWWVSMKQSHMNLTVRVHTCPLSTKTNHVIRSQSLSSQRSSAGVRLVQD